MTNRICRVCVLAKPTRTHREFQQFETANIAIFVKGGDQDEANERARGYLKQEHWELLEIQLSDRLIESEVRAGDPEVFALYEEALANGIAARVFTKNFAAGRDGIPAIRPPRVTEAFI